MITETFVGTTHGCGEKRMNGIVYAGSVTGRPSSAAHGKRAGLDGSVPGSQDSFGNNSSGG